MSIVLIRLDVVLKSKTTEQGRQFLTISGGWSTKSKTLGWLVPTFRKIE
jgi:hypothetical protein